MPYYLNSNQAKPKREALYSDLDPSMGMHPKTKDLLVLEDTAAVRRSIQNLLSTAYGERLFHPDIGASIRILTLFVDVLASPDTNSYDVSIEFGLRVSGEKTKFRTLLERIR